MGSFRITTNGVMRSYRANLNKSYKKLSDSMTQVQTHRQFNSYAEDPAAASRAFQLRRSIWRTDDHLTNNKHLTGIYNTAFSALKSMIDGDPESDVDTSFDGIKESLAGITGTAGAGRRPLGQTMMSMSDAIVQLMNSQYGENYVFAGADGLNVPFEWGKDENGGAVLLYRGINVDTTMPDKGESDFANPADFEAYKKEFQDKYGVSYEDAVENSSKLWKLDGTNPDGEHVYVDIGLGLEEDAQTGELISTSAFDSSLSGITVLGYGTDEDGDSKNLAVLMKDLGRIFNNCDAKTGEYSSPEDEATAERLVGKLRDALDRVGEQYDKISADAGYLKTNETLLNNTRADLEEQRASIEQIDPADAITDMMWGQYCYNAALKIGTSVLSQSLIDYMN